MTLRLRADDKGFKAGFGALLDTRRQGTVDVDGVVAEIIDDIRQRGDVALVDYTSRFDRLELTPDSLRLPESVIDEAARACPPETRAALELAHRRIRAYHQRQKPQDERFEDADGIGLGHRWTSLGAVGLYVPGGTASYPSSVLMNALPAIVAGVKRIAMVVPAPDGVLNPLVLTAAHLCGISEVYRIGGAQAVAALAYGTQTIAPVDKIVGPGNAYVAAAKRLVFGQCGIDMIAGPSEILVLADNANNPAWTAADLLSQAEHDVMAQSILITDDAGFADRVEAEIAVQLQSLPRGEIAAASWRDHGAIIVVDDLINAAPLINRIAPEHLEIATDDPERFLPGIVNAGSIFLGRMTPEAIGDYVGGSNHVLPTSGSARFSSGLNVLDFMKRTSILSCSADGLRRIGPAAVTLAGEEGLAAHARSVSIRLDSGK